MATAASLVAVARDRAGRLLRNREALTVLAFSGLSVVGGLVGNRLLTQVASPESLGELYLFTNLAQWLSLPTAAGYIYVVHHWPIAREHGVTQHLVRGIGRGLAVQAALGVLGALAFGLAMPAVPARAALAIAVLCVSTSVFQALIPIPNTERRRAASGVLGLLGGPARQFALALGVVAFAATSGLALLATSTVFQLAAAGAALAVFVRCYRAARSEGRPETPTSLISVRAFLTYSVPGLLAAFAAQIASSAERWGLAKLDDTATIALFVQAMGISLAATGAVTSVLTTYFYPFITGAAARSREDPLGAAEAPLRRFLFATAASQAGLALGAALFVRQITSLAFSARFAGVAELLPWTTLGGALFALGQAMTIVLFTARDALWPNLSRVLSQVLYSGALLALPHGAGPGRSFARYFVVGQMLYVGLVGWAIFRRLRERRLRLATPR